MATAYGYVQVVDVSDVASVSAIETAVNAQIETDEASNWVLVRTEVRVQMVNGQAKTLMYLTYQLDSIVSPYVDFIMQEVADPGTGAAIPVDKSADIQMTTGGSGETNTVADPAEVGLMLILRLTVDGGGNRVVTFASPINATGNNTATFGDAGDTLILVAARDGASTRCWKVILNDGVTLSTV